MPIGIELLLSVEATEGVKLACRGRLVAGETGIKEVAAAAGELYAAAWGLLLLRWPGMPRSVAGAI